MTMRYICIVAKVHLTPPLVDAVAFNVFQYTVGELAATLMISALPIMFSTIEWFFTLAKQEVDFYTRIIHLFDFGCHMVSWLFENSCVMVLHHTSPVWKQNDRWRWIGSLIRQRFDLNYCQVTHYALLGDDLILKFKWPRRLWWGLNAIHSWNIGNN